jgi:tetratricopeptide (TPR) repeat protein
MENRMQVFLSYSRNSARWAARSIKDHLERRGVDVFMDVENINSGRFATVILNEIGRRDHFIVLLTPETCERLRDRESWVRRELERALELRKNVVPVLLDGAVLDLVPAQFSMRAQLLELNAFPLPFELFSEAIGTLYERYLSNPTMEALEIRTAEEHFTAGAAAQEREEWAEAEREYEKAVGLRRRPEYLLGLSVAKHRQGRDLEALNDLDAAIAADPFAPEIMTAKFNLLQHMDRMKEAIALYGGGWKAQAEQRARSFAERIVKKVTTGTDLRDSVRSIPELAFLFGHLPALGQVGASMECLLEHISGDLQKELRDVWDAWRSRNELELREDRESRT